MWWMETRFSKICPVLSENAAVGSSETRLQLNPYGKLCTFKVCPHLIPISHIKGKLPFQHKALKVDYTLCKATVRISFSFQQSGASTATVWSVSDWAICGMFWLCLYSIWRRLALPVTASLCVTAVWQCCDSNREMSIKSRKNCLLKSLKIWICLKMPVHISYALPSSYLSVYIIRTKRVLYLSEWENKRVKRKILRKTW